MNLKNIFLTTFSYKPQNTDKFFIPDSPNNIETKEEEKNVSANYEENIKYIKTKYNTLINSDINLHEFEINISNKKFKACLLFVDGLVDERIY